MPTLSSASPIIVTTIPVTNGGNAKRMRPTIGARQVWNRPPTSTPPITVAIAPTPFPATSAIMMGMNAKLVPCTIGSRAPTGPKPIVWINVATPANSIDIWIM